METLHTTSPGARWPEFSPSKATPGNVSSGLSMDRRWTVLGLVALVLALGLASATAAGVLVWQRGRQAVAAAQRERAAEMAALEAQRRQAAAASKNAIAAVPAAAATSSMGAPGMPGDPMGEGGAMYGMAGSGYGAAYGAPAGFGMPGSMPGTDGMVAKQQLDAQIAPLVQRLREAQSDDQKAAVKRQLSSILEGYFDQDMQRRLQELTDIEARVQRLKQQCDQRQKAKEQILELQLKVLENEAAGLGFFGAQVPAASSDAYSGMMGGSAGMPGGYGSGGMPGMPGMGGMGGMGGMMGMGPMGGMGMEMPGLGGMGAAMGSGSSARVPAPFLKRTALDFTDTPLQEVCDWLREESGTNILLDTQALKEKGIAPQTPVTLNVRDISVAGALELLADYCSDQLGVRFEDGVGMITHRDYNTVRPETDGWPASQRTASLLKKTADYSLLQDVPLADALGSLSAAAQVDVFLNRRSLQKTSISPASPVSLNLKGVSHRTALKLMLHNLDQSLYFSLVDGVVVVAAKEVASSPFASPPPYVADPFAAPPGGGNPLDSTSPAASNAAAPPPPAQTPAQPADDPAATPPSDDRQD